MRCRVAALLSVGLALVLFVSCPSRQSQPASTVVGVCVTDFDPALFAVQSATVAEARRSSTVIWLVRGDVLSDAVPDDTGRRGAVGRLLAAGGVDAALLTPSWLIGSPAETRRAIDATGVYVLGCRIVDSLGGLVGHQLMVKRAGSVRVGLTGVWLDTLPSSVSSRGYELLAAERVVPAAVALLRQRADAVGIILGPAQSPSGRGVDFAVGADFGGLEGLRPSARDELAMIELRFSGGTLTKVMAGGRRLTATAPDTLVARLADRLAGW